MTVASMLRRPSAFIPVAMAAAALALIGGYVALNGVAANEDEGAAARIFQLLMLGQLVGIGVFAARWLPRAPRPALVVLILQLAAWTIPVAVITWLESTVAR
jgi:hypothetical protein